MKNGLDDFLVRYGAEAFRELVRKAKPTLELHVEENTSTNLILGELTRLNNVIERKKILKQIAVRERVSVEDVQSEYQKYTPKQKDNTENEGSETFTPDELAQAKELLRSPNIMEKMLDLTTRRGYVGEEINKRMLYLSFTSRLMDNSISCVIKGVSASGKSSLAHGVLTLFPKKDVLSYSFITGKALTHFGGDLSHKVLLVEERQGAEAADYSIRTSLSEGELSILIPTKNEATGDFKTIEKRIEAKGLVYLETTTRERIHPENQTRLFDLFMDESPEQTDRVLKAQAKAQDSISPELEQESKIWRAAQTLLGQCSVNIPYAERLVEAFPKDKPRVRRDFKRFLTLIRSHASLYQFQRERDPSGRIIATLEDLESTLPITEVVLIQSHKEISPKLEKVLEAIEKNFGVNQEFSFGELEEKVEFKDRTLRNHLKRLVGLEFISHNGKTGKESRYTLLSSLSSVSSMSNFRSKLAKTLEKIEENSNFPQIASISLKNDGGTKIEENKENRGKNIFSSMDVNKDDDLHQETLIEEIRKDGIKEIGISDSPFEIKKITYATGDVVYQVAKLGENGKPTFHIITPDLPEFEDVQREYEQRSR